MILVKYKDLVSEINSILLKEGTDKFTAESVSIGLAETSLRGVDSHGIRLFPHYLKALRSGRINGKPNFKINNKFPAFVGLNADNAFGHAAGFKSIDIGMEIANKLGICAISVTNSSHPGAMASFALKAAKNGFCSFAFTHADSLVQSFNSKDSFFGTNPICFAAPRKDEQPYCIDMAPTFIPWNKILECKENNKNLDSDYAVDSDGKKTNDPFKAKALLPIGGYKGFALASMVEVLCSNLSGMNFGPHIPSMYGSPIDKPRKLAQFFIVFRCDVNLDSEEFEELIHKMSQEVRQQKTNSYGEQVMMPNDPQIKFEKERGNNGIPVTEDLYEFIFNGKY